MRRGGLSRDSLYAASSVCFLSLGWARFHSGSDTLPPATAAALAASLAGAAAMPAALRWAERRHSLLRHTLIAAHRLLSFWVADQMGWSDRYLSEAPRPGLLGGLRDFGALFLGQPCRRAVCGSMVCHGTAWFVAGKVHI